MNDEESVTYAHSQLFTLRLWAEEGPDGQREWRGKLRHVLTGDVRYFRDWPALIPVLLAMLRTLETTPPTDGDPSVNDNKIATQPSQ